MSLQAYITQIGANFSAGRYHLLAEGYTYPLPFYVNGEPRLIKSPEEMMGFLENLHSHLSADGLTELEGKLVSVELAKTGRFRLWTDWTACGETGCKPVMQTISYNRGSHMQCETEMLQFALTETFAETLALTAA